MAVIRPFRQPEDVAGVARLILPIQQEEFGIAITAADQPDLVDVDGFYRSGAGDFWVAVDEAGGIVGSIALKDIGGGQGALRKMFVAAGHRGDGTARALLEHLLSEARARGFTGIFLGTTAKYLAAHRFYEKHGFAEIHADDLPARFPRMAVDSKFYRRVL